MTSRQSRDFSDRVFLKHKSKLSGDCCVVNFSGVVWTEKIWCLSNRSLPLLLLLRLTALVFVYDYHPGAETLLMRHFSGPDSTLAVGPDGTLLFPSNPRAGGISNRHRPGGHRSPMPERLIWSYIIQLSSALRTVHASGLACRVIDPSKILLIGNSRWTFVCKTISRRRRVNPLAGVPVSCSQARHLTPRIVSPLGWGMPRTPYGPMAPCWISFVVWFYSQTQNKRMWHIWCSQFRRE